MRTFLAGVLGLVAAVLLPMGVVSTWLATVIGDTDAYVGTVAPLARDADVQDAVAERVEVELERRVPALGTAGPLVRKGVKTVVSGPLFPPAWEKSNRAAHQQLVAVLEDRSDGKVVLQLAPVAQAVVDEVDSTGLLGGTRVPPVGVQVADSGELEQARGYYEVLESAGPVLPVLGGGAALGAIVFARRRLRSLAVLGFTAALTFGATWLALGGVRQGLIDSVPEQDETLAGAVWDVVTADLGWMLVLGLGLSVALGLTGGIASAVAGRRPTA